MSKAPMPKKEDGSAERLFEKLGPAGRSKHMLTGMVRRVEGDNELIEFARRGNCSKWVKIPADQVEDIKLLHIVPCDGHSHPLVNLFMKEPTSPDGLAFAALADLHSTFVQAIAAPDVTFDPTTDESAMPWNKISLPAGFLPSVMQVGARAPCPDGAQQQRLCYCQGGRWIAS